MMLWRNGRRLWRQKMRPYSGPSKRDVWRKWKLTGL
jgi:hypothetical protein